MSDNNTTLQALKNIASTFIKERDWRQFHGGKNVSIGIAIEAAELMEIFVWATGKQEIDELITTKKEAIEHELADILFGLLAFADEYNIDLSQALSNKMKHNAQKYPVTACKGKNTKYTEY